MPVYSYEGREERTGEIVSGTREAANHAMLGQDLLQEGVLLTRFEEKTQRAAGVSIYSSIVGRVPTLEKALFARYFALMLKAGLDVKRALEALKEQSRSKPMRQAIEGVHHGVEKGETIADSMRAFPLAFPALFISFVQVGETTGRLQEALEVLAQQMQKEYDLRRAVRGAMLYPAVIMVALGAVGFAMLVFVVPRLAEVFEGFDVELPLATRVLIGIGSFFEVFWWLVLIGLFLAGIAGWFLWRVPTVRARLLHAMIYTPILGPIMQQVNLARFTRSLSSLIQSGVSFVEALGLLGENTPHPSYAKVFQGAQEHVKTGKNLSDWLVSYKRLFPPLVVNVIKVGEETGELDAVLQEIALFYESEVDQTLKNLTSILEPILMVVIGLAVGALAVSVISPIYDLVNVI